MPHQSNIDEPRWAGVREVTAMSWPIILGSLSYTVMEFTDKLMVARVGTEQLAAVGSAGVWSYTLSTFVLGIVGCVSTFVSQSIGRGRAEDSGAYAWQGIWLSMLAAVLALALWPLSGPLFRAMGHDAAVTAYELEYFRIRLLGYLPMVWGMGLGAFFQAVNRSNVPMYSALAGNICNIGLNYLLIYGRPEIGIPRLEVAGAAYATVASQFLQMLILQGVFLAPAAHRQFATRTHWRPDPRRIRELLRIGIPAGGAMLLDVCNWAIFISFIVGYAGTAQLAANNVALSFMQVSFMPAIALNQGIAPIVGQWIGRGDIARAKARAYTAARMAIAYMMTMGVIVAFYRTPLVRLFNDQPEVVDLGGKLLLLAALFQGFDGLNVVLMGALRGAGDTRWIMYITAGMAYLVFLPAASVFSIGFGAGAFGAWIGASLYIMICSTLFLLRFHGEAWRSIRIFDDPNPALDRPAATA